MANGAAALSDLDPRMQLEHVFWHFFTKFQRLPEPRSVAEARISEHEVQFLGSWFTDEQADRFGNPGDWCERTWQERVEEGVTASSREMFGALFLTFAAEVCRGQCGEESVWPTISEAFRRSKRTHAALFANREPTEVCKAAMAAGARRLRLRNLIDREGRQEYFDTLKLQIGFTLKGAIQRLPEWLSGVSQPTAVRILLGYETEAGDLHSADFQNLWRSLKDYRRSRVSREYVFSVLESSAWIHTAWISDLLGAATERYNASEEEAVSEDRSMLPGGALCEPKLVWENGWPALRLSFHENQIRDLLEDHEAAKVVVDRQVVDRWTRQESGQWRGRLSGVPCQKEGAKPNLKPQLLSINSGDALVVEIDLGSELGLNEPLLVFDAASGERRASSATLDVRREYAFLCDPDMEVVGARPPWKSKERLVYRLAPPLSAEVVVLCGGEPYWQPQIAGAPVRRSFNLRVESPPGEVVEVGSTTKLLIAGVPEDVTGVGLGIGAQSHRAVRDGAAWRTETVVRVSLDMALGEERVRVRVTGIDFTRTIPVKLSLNIRGIAILEAGGEDDEEPRWRLLKQGYALNRAGGAGKARVLVEAPRAEVYEGPHLVRRLTSPVLDFASLYGWGYPLVVRRNAESEITLVESVRDQGYADFRGIGKYLKVGLRTPVLPSQEHAVLLWSDIDGAPIRRVPPQVSSDGDGFVWTLTKPDRVVAAAATYRGAWLGAYCNGELIAPALLRPPSASRFALLRWLKFPVLDERFRSQVQRAVSRVPAEFVRGWLGDELLPPELFPRTAEEGLDIVIRAFLWAHREQDERRIWELVKAFPRGGADIRDPVERVRYMLTRMGEMCPSLAYNLARLSLRGIRAREYRDGMPEVVESLVERSSLGALGRDCADLIGVSNEHLIAAVEALRSYLDGRVSKEPSARDLRRLGERERGRRYLTAALLSSLLERKPAIW